jgi:hypothetical protein
MTDEVKMSALAGRVIGLLIKRVAVVTTAENIKKYGIRVRTFNMSFASIALWNLEPTEGRLSGRS